MATQLSGVWNQFSSAHAFRMVRPAAANADTGAGSGSSEQAAGITANDFLTLLVTEMKNQDPTAQTDPNEYVNQLVQVNSLQQLISINETLHAGLGAVSGDTSVPAPDAREISLGSQTPSAPEASSATIAHSAGNLTSPVENPSAKEVANALVPNAVRSTSFHHGR